ncbi:hypothetical protein OIU76_015866 [Salix suchowensis]|nr:hypothetical protein OIU76_015866 [Salix suchowensis]
MLSLHEASYLATKNEEILLQAQKLTRTSLQQLMPLMSSNCSSYVAQALKLPRHLRMARLESRNYISCYRKEKNFNLDLFQLARVDFNMVQQLHNTELTEIVRWDLGAMEHLPEYMKICYMALFNTTNNIGYRILKKQGWNVVPHLKRTWIDIVEAFLVEAKWFDKNYVPSPEEYLANGVTTGGTYMALVHAFFLMGQNVTNETAAMMEPYPNLFSVSGKILRLWDDLGTAEEEQERGDVASSIQCYTNEKDFSSEKEAREHIRNLISSSWLELNGELVSPTAALPLSIVKASLNLGRTAQVVYEHGDDENASCVAENVQALIYTPVG